MTGTQWLTIASKRRQDDGVSPAGCKQKRDERIPLVACKKRQGHNNKSISKEESYAIQPWPNSIHTSTDVNFFKEVRVVEDPKSSLCFLHGFKEYRRKLREQSSRAAKKVRWDRKRMNTCSTPSSEGRLFTKCTSVLFSKSFASVLLTVPSCWMHHPTMPDVMRKKKKRWWTLSHYGWYCKHASTQHELQ